MPVSVYRRTCDACPSQWDVYDRDGKYWYVRYRGGRLTTGESVGEISRLIRDISAEDPFDGYMEDVDMLDWLEKAGIMVRGLSHE